MLATFLLLSIVLGPEAQSQPMQVISADCATTALAPLGETTFVAVPAVQEGRPGITAILIHSSHLSEIRSVFFPVDAPPSCVAAATSGADVMVVWTGADGLLQAMLLEPDLDIIEGPARMISARYGQSTGVAWQRGAGTYLAVAGSYYLEIRRSDLRFFHAGSVTPWTFRGVTHGPFDKSVTYDAVATSDVASAVSALGVVPAQTTCVPGRSNCASFAEAWSVAVARPHPVTPVELESRGEPIGRTTVALTGERALTGWIRYRTRFNVQSFDVVARWVDETTTLEVRSGQSFVRNLTSASDGQHVIMVWEEGFPTTRIAGALIDRDGLRESFVVSESAASPRKPSVIAVESGRYLVAYELTAIGNTTQLAGRIVYVDPPERRRAAR